MREGIVAVIGPVGSQQVVLTQKIYADPERSKQVGDAILERVEKKTTPQMRVRVATLAEAMKQAQAAKIAKPVEPLPPR